MNVPQSLAENGIPVLYGASSPDAMETDDAPLLPSFHLQGALLRLVERYMTQYRELVDSLPTLTPEDRHRQLDGLRHVLMNMHHLLNLYRPMEALHFLDRHVTEQLRIKAELLEELRK